MKLLSNVFCYGTVAMSTLSQDPSTAEVWLRIIALVLAIVASVVNILHRPRQPNCGNCKYQRDAEEVENYDNYLQESDETK